MKTFTRDEMLEITDEAIRPAINRWLNRGDGCAVYQNMDFESITRGWRKFVSFGSAAAQLETDTPPTRLPDLAAQINWRYQLEGIYKGRML